MRFSSLATCAAMAATLALAAPAKAHFILWEPPAATDQDIRGNPQKGVGCGGGTLNNVVTTVRSGDTVTVRWAEETFHTGHFRISLAKTEAELIDPVVGGNVDMCETAAVMNPPVMPVLADNVNDKTVAKMLVYETSVKIPENFTCDKCFLQVIQFMSNHAAPCFYHHCAQLRVTAAGAGGSTTSADSASKADAVGGCAIGGRAHNAAFIALAPAGLIAALLWRRRLRRR